MQSIKYAPEVTWNNRSTCYKCQNSECKTLKQIFGQIITDLISVTLRGVFSVEKFG